MNSQTQLKSLNKNLMIKIMYQDPNIGLVGVYHLTRIEFWLDGDSRIHERLNYTIDKSGNWIKSLLSP